MLITRPESLITGGSTQVACEQGEGQSIEHPIVESEVRPEKTLFCEAAFVQQSAGGEVVRLYIGDEPIDLGVPEYPSAGKADCGGPETFPAGVRDEPVAEFAVAFRMS